VNDAILVGAGGTALTSGGVITFDFTRLTKFGVGSYTVLQSTGGGFTQAGTSYAVGVAPTGYNFVLSATDTAVTLTTTLLSNRYWTNSQATGSWNTFNGGGTLSAGSNSAGINHDGVGSLNVNGDMLWESSSALVFDFNNAAGSLAGTDWDLISLTGGARTLDVTGGPNSIRVDVRSWLQNDSAYGANTLNPDRSEPNYSWLWVDTGVGGTLGSGFTIDVDGRVTNFYVDGSQAAAVSPATAPLMGSFWVSTLNNDLYLNYSAVPEPNSMLLCGVAGLGFAAYRRRKSRRADSSEVAESAAKS
jgi:hypothetical protein